MAVCLRIGSVKEALRLDFLEYGSESSLLPTIKSSKTESSLLL